MSLLRPSRCRRRSSRALSSTLSVLSCSWRSSAAKDCLCQSLAVKKVTYALPVACKLVCWHSSSSACSSTSSCLSPRSLSLWSSLEANAFSSLRLARRFELNSSSSSFSVSNCRRSSSCCWRRLSKLRSSWSSSSSSSSRRAQRPSCSCCRLDKSLSSWSSHARCSLRASAAKYCLRY